MRIPQRRGAVQRFLQNRARLGVQRRSLIQLHDLLHPVGELRRIDGRTPEQGARLLPRGGGFFEMAVAARLPDRLDGRVQGILLG